ncbi:MAG: MotA/TolQ/ExbB proton channel family protein, partial [Oscillospiraceae bacterium]
MLSPAIIVFGGTFGAVLVSYSMKEISSIPRVLLSLNKSICAKTGDTIGLLELFADKARRGGLLSLEQTINESEIQKKTSPFFKKAILLCIDGTEAKLIRETLEIELYVTEQRKKIEIGMFEAAGGFSPTMGIIGTVMGLVQVLSNMGSPEELAKSIAVAFIATLYGVGFANLLYLPVAGKLKLKLKNYQMECELIIEGVISIQCGESPQILHQ